MQEKDDQSPTGTKDGVSSDKSERAPEVDWDDVELVPVDEAPKTAKKLPGQFDEHDKTLKALEKNWNRIDPRRRVRREGEDRRLQFRFGARDRRLSNFDRRRENRGWKGRWF